MKLDLAKDHSKLEQAKNEARFLGISILSMVLTSQILIFGIPNLVFRMQLDTLIVLKLLIAYGQYSYLMHCLRSNSG